MSRICAIVLGGASLLGACSSGGTSGLSNDQALGARYFAARNEAATTTPATAADLPTIAHLKGFIGADLLPAGATIPAATLIGATEFTADFTNGNLTGTASHFGLYDRATGTAAPVSKTADLGGALTVTGTIRGTRFDYQAAGTLAEPATSGGTADVAVTLTTATEAAPVYVAEGISLEPIYSGSYPLGGMGEPVTEPVVVVGPTPAGSFALADGQLVASALITGSFAPTAGSALAAGTLQDGLLLVAEP